MWKVWYGRRMRIKRPSALLGLAPARASKASRTTWLKSASRPGSRMSNASGKSWAGSTQCRLGKAVTCPVSAPLMLA